ncbi:hypothetical protein RchiOBHm_Chr2g0094661 [Rosa chinensis]|uniref:Uncharacterized protein n=1 Tax=Rosa chinensis TaxID=74649 RepID=A0A2P6RKK4_ROSCH|nr:hypothetical protein RchiOBHm_Chr2g0094661 [Rosa chinensis]
MRLWTRKAYTCRGKLILVDDLLADKLLALGTRQKVVSLAERWLAAQWKLLSGEARGCSLAQR